MKIRLLLNVLKRNNYVFFDPDNGVHLSLSSPVGLVRTISPSVKRAILSGNVIDLDKSTGIEVDERIEYINNIVLEKLGYVRHVVSENVVVEEEIVVEEPIEEVVEEVVEEKPKTKKPKKKETSSEDNEGGE